VIEDAAHSLGSRFLYNGKTYAVGGHPWADMTTFSFHPVKTLTTGEGGAIATDNDELATRCRLLRSHGMERTRPDEPWFYEMRQPGYNYRITDIQCALGLSQLSRLEQFIGRRQAVVDEYTAAFSHLKNFKTPSLVSSGRSAWHLYVVQIDFPQLGKSRAQVMQELKKRGIGTQVHYIPVHLQPYYRNRYGYAPGKCPQAEAYYEQCLSLPLYPAMTDEDVLRVIAAVREVIS
jgi:dTDP-4-amino-4,6-dideoxygalactose transaminase